MKNIQKIKLNKRNQRHRRVRAKVHGTLEKPRLSTYRSLTHIYAQIIDDLNHSTLVQANDTELKKSAKIKATKSEIAKEVGVLLAKKALEKKIKNVVFDRGGYKYHGRIKSLADGAREGGLVF